MHCDVAHDGARTRVSLPAGWRCETVAVKDHPSLENLYSAARRVLRSPMAALPLRRIVRDSDRVCLIVPDNSRPMHQGTIVRAILDELSEAQVNLEQVTVVIALGTHPPMSDSEIRKLLGSDTVDRVLVRNHDCRLQAELVDLGVTAQGTPIHLNRTVHSADVRIGIGNVKPHFSAGWSGGAKIIDPGVCGEATVGYTHWHSTFHPPTCLYGKAENPMRQEIEEIGATVGLEFIVNVVLNKRDEPAFLSAGDFIEAHRQCVRYAEQDFTVNIAEKADLLLVGMGLWAKDFWAAIVGFFMAEFLVRPGGTVILFADCPQGIAAGHPDIELHGYPKPQVIRELVASGSITDLAAASHMYLAGRLLHECKLDLIVVSSSVGPEVWSRLGIKSQTHVEPAIDAVVARHGPTARAHVLSATSIADTLIVPKRL